MFSHRAPLEQAGLLERHPVVLVDRAWAAGLPLTESSGRRLEQVGDQPQQGRLPHPDGPISETNSPGPDREIDAVERVDLIRPAGVEHLFRKPVHGYRTLTPPLPPLMLSLGFLWSIATVSGQRRRGDDRTVQQQAHRGRAEHGRVDLGGVTRWPAWLYQKITARPMPPLTNRSRSHRRRSRRPPRAWPPA